MYSLEYELSGGMSLPAFRMLRDFSPPPIDARSRTFRVERIVKPDVRTTGMNLNGISSSAPVGWFTRRNVIFITSVAAKFPRKFQIYILHERARSNISWKSEVKARTTDGCENDVNISDKNITQCEWCAWIDIIYFIFL